MCVFSFWLWISLLIGGRLGWLAAALSAFPLSASYEIHACAGFIASRPPRQRESGVEGDSSRLFVVIALPFANYPLLVS